MEDPFVPNATDGSPGAEAGPSGPEPDPFEVQSGLSSAEPGTSVSAPVLPPTVEEWKSRRKRLGILEKTTIHHLPEHQSASKITETQYLALQILCIPCALGILANPNIRDFLSPSVRGENELAKVQGWDVYIDSINLDGWEMKPSTYEDAHSCSLLRHRQLMVDPRNTSKKDEQGSSTGSDEVSNSEESASPDATPSRTQNFSSKPVLDSSEPAPGLEKPVPGPPKPFHGSENQESLDLLSDPESESEMEKVGKQLRRLQIGSYQTPDRQHSLNADPEPPKKPSAPEKLFVRPGLCQYEEGGNRSLDEQIVNDAIITLLQILTQKAAPKRLIWSSHRRAFLWSNGSKEFEARVDGYLMVVGEGKVLAITETKADRRGNMKQVIMQEGGEMIAWINELPPEKSEFKVREKGEGPTAEYDQWRRIVSPIL